MNTECFDKCFNPHGSKILVVVIAVFVVKWDNSCIRFAAVLITKVITNEPWLYRFITIIYISVVSEHRKTY